MSIFSNKWSQIKAKGLPALWRKLWKKLANLFIFAFNAIWAVPAVMLIRLIKPFMHVRLGTLLSSRIGHFVADSSIFLARQSLRPLGERVVECFWFPEPTCNKQWSRMVRRQLFVRWWVRYLTGFNRLIPGGACHDNPMPVIDGSRIVYDALRQSKARFEFSLREEEDAKSFLRLRGWRDGEEWICLLVRDSAYLNLHPLHANEADGIWDYHDYRDSDINTYLEAMRVLLEKGWGRLHINAFP